MKSTPGRDADRVASQTLCRGQDPRTGNVGSAALLASDCTGFMRRGLRDRVLGG